MVTVPFQKQDEKKETPNQDGPKSWGLPSLVKELHVHGSSPSRGGLPCWCDSIIFLENFNSPVCGWPLHDGEWPGLVLHVVDLSPDLIRDQLTRHVSGVPQAGLSQA